MNSRITIPIFVPHKGCPNDCYFCNQRRITGFVDEMTPDRARGIIEEYLSFCRDDRHFEIAFFGGSFTAIPKEKRRKLLEVAKEYIDKDERIDYAHISTRPDCIDDEVLDELKTYGVRIIELGVQSLDEDVLRQSNRGHDGACVYRSTRKIKEKGFLLGLQMMTGLKGDTAERSLNTARRFVLLKPDMVRIYPALVIKDTVFEQQLQRGEYRPWSLEETIDVVKRCKVLFERNGIRVMRMGLQPSDTVQLGSSVVDGPFHAAFGELVYTAMYRDFLENVLIPRSCFDGQKGEEGEGRAYIRNKGEPAFCMVGVNRRDISKWVGEKRSTCEYFRSKYGLELRFKPHDEEAVAIGEMTYRPEEVIEALYRHYALHEEGGCMEALELRPALPTEEKEIMALLEETATWLKEKGSKQWNGILEGKDNHHTDVAIAKGYVFVLEEEQKIEAFMILYPNKTAWDTVLWREEEEMDAFYLHRLTLSLDRRGEKLAHRCLQWAIDYARKQGKTAVRLDCLKKVPYLNRLYTEAGFKHLRTVEDFNANEQIADFNLYEYRL